ncbi:MAG: hypothetical protein DI570_21690 [Phenylobacterium zucineum]|nr:MAG: hypothetical protein DI570_21690 [Phenylobacterium zucineum]
MDPEAVAESVQTQTASSSTAMRVLVEAEAQFESLGAAFDGDRLISFRTLISGYPDMGAPGDGEVVASLFMLLGRFVAGGRVDREALSVHLRAWRLLLTTDLSEAAAAKVVAGLRAVLRRYADAEAA